MESNAAISPLLLDKAIAITVQSRWLILLKVQIATDEIAGQLRFLVSPGVVIKEVKKLIQTSSRGIPPENQRLCIPGAFPRPLLSGPVFAQLGATEADQEMEILLHVVPLDPRLEALFEMVHVGSVDERDELMAMMMTHRQARKCVNGHKLIVWEHPLNDIPLQENFKTCQKCGLPHGGEVWPHSGPVYICPRCDFALCNLCYENDSGRGIPDDPYDELTDMALTVAKEFTLTSTWFGSGDHVVIKPQPIQWAFEIRPQAYRKSKSGIRLDFSTQVLHCGIRLKVQVDDDIRAILNAEGKDWRGIEVDKELPNGATVLDLIPYRQILRTSSVWQHISKTIDARFQDRQAQLAQEVREWISHSYFPPPEIPNEVLTNIFESIDLISYSLEEVVFRISVLSNVS